MAENVDDDTVELERRASELAKLLPFAPRAFVIEFAGTPKAGKSTSVEAIRHFFSRQGFTVHILVERASVCPIPMKGHLFFNTWCAATMLAELLANVDTETDIIIVDRGLFDALVWLTLQRQRGEVTEGEKKTIESFLLLDRWRMLIDLAVVMNVNAKEAISRENSQRISSKPGSIMNSDVLVAITQAVKDAVESYGPQFGNVFEHLTSGENIKKTNIRLANRIIDSFEEFLNPEILVVPKVELSKLPLHNGGAFTPTECKQLSDCVSKFGTFIRRADAETSAEFVQIIPCGLLLHQDEVFLFERKERDPKYRLYGKLTIWQGCHVPKSKGVAGIKLLENALLDRIARNLYLSRTFPMEMVGYCWDPDDEKSNRHFGVVFKVSIDNEHTAVDLRKKEFRRAREHALGGRFVKPSELSSPELRPNLETWSASILNGFEDLGSAVSK